MKKPSSLAQQIQQAQREFNSWTPERKASVRLEGSSALLARVSEQKTPVTQSQRSANRKK